MKTLDGVYLFVGDVVYDCYGRMGDVKVRIDLWIRRC